jgi:hypothetical protein
MSFQFLILSSFTAIVLAYQQKTAFKPSLITIEKTPDQTISDTSERSGKAFYLEVKPI